MTLMTICIDPGFLEKIPVTTPRVSKTCEHCGVVKVIRSFHCPTCNLCVLRLDHHSLWLNKCIGSKNHALYFFTLAVSLITSTCILLLSSTVMYNAQGFVKSTLLFFFLSLLSLFSTLLYFFMLRRQHKLVSLFYVFHNIPLYLIFAISKKIQGNITFCENANARYLIYLKDKRMHFLNIFDKKSTWDNYKEFLGFTEVNW